MAISAQPINTIPQARELAAKLSTRYWYATQPLFADGKVIGFFVRLEKKDYRGVSFDTAFLRGEEAQDFLKAIKAGADEQELIKAWFAEAK